LRRIEYLPDEVKKKQSSEFFKTLNEKIGASNAPEALRVLLWWLFPAFERGSEERVLLNVGRSTSRTSREEEKRICSADYFPVYFRSSVPDEMFSNTELRTFLDALDRAQNRTAAEATFHHTLSSIPAGNAKRDDFFLKLGRSVADITPVAAGYLAGALAKDAHEYAYDLFHIGEGARAVNVVFHLAQASPGSAETLLETAIENASDDTFAEKILHFCEDRERNGILTDFSTVDVTVLTAVFLARMRNRYGADNSAVTVNIKLTDWSAFRRWVTASDEDREIEQKFWRQFIDGSRRKFAQAVMVLYPDGFVWSDNPTTIINTLFPIEDLKRLFEDLPQEPLDEKEQRALDRLSELFQGRYQHA
jgi:hypothetical protein